MELGGLHLGYCTNIHAGETWPEVQESLQTRLLEVRRRVAPAQKFGIGLRLSAIAAEQLERPGELAQFREFLAAHDLYVYTINGFPFGQFHGTRVKERVYLPDWLDDARVEYSDRLARILAAILPEGIEGSISTVPGAFAPRASDETSRRKIADNLCRHAATLARIEAETGKKISLALEPEPACMLETSQDAVEFFERYSLPRGHLGVCLDACHMAVELEEPEDTVERFRRAGVRIVKAQISAGLKVSFGDDAEEKLRALEPFAEGVYLHQVVEKRGEKVRRFVDLPDAISAAAGAAAGEWRIHFHVPIFLERLGVFENTQAELARLLHLIRRTGCTSHLEVETYCWDVLPVEHKCDDVGTSIARELAWAKGELER